jgi:hypothetical protein
MDLSNWTEEWEEDQPWIVNPNWGPEDQLTFNVLQYFNLDEEQIRAKLSQMPRGAKLYFQTYSAEQMGSPVSMGKQQAVLQGLRKYAGQFGVTIEERPQPPYNSPRRLPALCSRCPKAAVCRGPQGFGPVRWPPDQSSWAPR